MSDEPIAKFHLAFVTSAKNSKNSIAILEYIQLEGEDDAFYLPPDAQPISCHDELLKVPIVSTNIKAMTQRGQYQTVKVKLKGAIHDIYLDKDGNVQFKDHFLQQGVPKTKGETPTKQPDTAIKKSLQSITKDIVIQKYSSKTQNAEVWLRSFNKECDRLLIPEVRRAEAMRLFLDRSPLEWFNAQWITNGTDTWQGWEMHFLEAFADKGWNEVWYAINYRWNQGTTYTDYIIKKNCLLIESFSELSEKSRVAIIIVGLPREVRDKIDRNSISTQGKLLSEISKWDSNNTGYNKVRKTNNQNEESEKEKRADMGKKRNPNHKPCSWCERRGYREKYHPEKVCWYNPAHPDYKPPRQNGSNINSNSNGMKGNNSNNEKTIRVANNTELETLFNENINSKN
jgi:RNase H-fold protein (predicted Holliday junction resolvase)